MSKSTSNNNINTWHGRLAYAYGIGNPWVTYSRSDYIVYVLMGLFHACVLSMFFGFIGGSVAVVAIMITQLIDVNVLYISSNYIPVLGVGTTCIAIVVTAYSKSIEGLSQFVAPLFVKLDRDFVCDQLLALSGYCGVNNKDGTVTINNDFVIALGGCCLSQIHKVVKQINGDVIVHGSPTNILGLLKIPGVEMITVLDYPIVSTIMTERLKDKDVLLAQDQLIEAGYPELAKL